MKKTALILLLISFGLFIVMMMNCGGDQVSEDEMEADTIPYTIEDTSWADKNECSDGIDNDWDGLADYYGVPAHCNDDGNPQDCIYLPDPSCQVVINGIPSKGESECRDRLDNDGDGFIDDADFSCAPCGVYIPVFGEDEYTTTPDCCNGIDDDGDGNIDWEDTDSCYSPYDIYEEGACGNGLDDDNDGKVDFGEDPGCTSIYDNDETDVQQGSTP